MLILLLANLSLHHYCIHNSDSIFSFCGDRQKYGIDYQLVFAPTIKYQTLRTLLLALAAYYDLEIEHFDVVTAFLDVELTDVEDVYMAQPYRWVREA